MMWQPSLADKLTSTVSRQVVRWSKVENWEIMKSCTGACFCHFLNVKQKKYPASRLSRLGFQKSWQRSCYLWEAKEVSQQGEECLLYSFQGASLAGSKKGAPLPKTCWVTPDSLGGHRTFQHIWPLQGSMGSAKERTSHFSTWPFPTSFVPMLNLPMFHCVSYSSASSFCFFPKHLGRVGTRQAFPCMFING